MKSCASRTDLDRLLRLMPIFLPILLAANLEGESVAVHGMEVVELAPDAILFPAETDLHRALTEEARGVPDCVDRYFCTALFCWNLLADESLGHDDVLFAKTWNLYHSALAGLIRAGQRHGQLNPRRHLRVCGAEGPVAITYSGFVWKPDDFDRLEVMTPNETRNVARDYRYPGLGLPLVVFRKRKKTDGYLSDRVPFAATAILRTEVAPIDCDACRVEPGDVPAPSLATLELIDPVRVQTTTLGRRKVPLMRDLSAPYAYLLKNADNTGLRDFFRPLIPNVGGGLQIHEPYQPGKIPIVFVHGLLSSELTWIDLANDLRAVPWFNERFQSWTFHYATGVPFLRSAADMRQQCREAIAEFDPEGQDPALSQMVLIGHSLGGLVSKLQVTHSDSLLWQQVSVCPLDTIRVAPEVREDLRRVFFFEPQPFVRRVIFIGTPHRGSSWASRMAGVVGSCLVTPAEEQKARHRVLIETNPGVFTPNVQGRLPTSVDLLDPEDPVLVAMNRLRLNPAVQLHSIIGTGKPSLTDGPADGVVLVSSAQHPAAVSERYVHARHTKLHHHPDAVSEILRILRIHSSP